MATAATLKYPVFIKVGENFVEVGEVEIPITITAGKPHPGGNLRGARLGTTEISITPTLEQITEHVKGHLDGQGEAGPQ